MKMDKIEQLIKMMEHPEQYSETQWEEILNDDDCREYYQLMSKTDSALNNKDISQETIEKEWAKIEKKHADKGRLNKNRHLLKRFKIAATIIGVFLISGIAYAAIFSLIKDRKPVQQEIKAVATIDKGVIKSSSKADTTKVIAKIPVIKQYDDTPLESILNDMAAYYNIKVKYQHQNVCKLRLFYKWDQSLGIATVVDQLNNFEKFHINLDGQIMTVE
jgi:hypothetical protein